MTVTLLAILILYFLSLLFLFSFSLVQLKLVWNYFRATRKVEISSSRPSSPFDRLRVTAGERSEDNVEPPVCIQLPIYNERFVVERLLHSVLQMDYPKDKLHIQVLDDSDDETTETLESIVQKAQKQGFQIELIRRANREGFKAGALQFGLERTEAEFIAIFDADFLPKRDFLKNCISEMQDLDVACVQTRWDHLNHEENLLTRSQSMALDAHFTVEQIGRSSGGHFTHFNGTAGLWRKRAIVDAGGWSGETLTEDLDLSYRAQMRGWKIAYRGDILSPAELPMALSALRTQQNRWNKGAAECSRKHLGSILSLARIGVSTKLVATYHLLNSAVFISVFLLSVLSVPLILLRNEIQELPIDFRLAWVFAISLLAMGFFFFIPFGERKRLSGFQAFVRFVPEYFSFMSISLAFAPFNTVAVVSGYLGIKTPFIRTPKFNAEASDYRQNPYMKLGFPAIFYLEVMLFLYYAYGLYLGISGGTYGLIPMHSMLLFGLGSLIYFSLRENRAIS